MAQYKIAILTGRDRAAEYGDDGSGGFAVTAQDDHGIRVLRVAHSLWAALKAHVSSDKAAFNAIEQIASRRPRESSDADKVLEMPETALNW